MKIAILGFGTIGTGVYEIIKNYPAKQLQSLEVTKILDLPQNKDKLDIITSNVDDILLDESIGCVVETMGGIHPAYEFICAALRHKKHVVTANKAVVAAHLEEFIKLANENHVQFLFEASTGGGIPWIASLHKAKRVDQISGFYGIFNGTTNYILDAMYHQGKDFDEVLKKAQDLGYAEADPSADIDGYDVQNKVVISSALAFNSKVEMDDFPSFGIRNIIKQDIEYFKSLDYVVKFIGEATSTDGSYEAFVMPNLFDRNAVESNIGSNFNIATLFGTSIGPLKFYGQGAGKLPTANAIIQDILDIKNPDANYNLDFANTLKYQPQQKNNYILRTNNSIQSEYVDKKDMFEGSEYTYTKAIDAVELMKLVNEINDEKLFVAKVATFEG